MTINGSGCCVRGSAFSAIMCFMDEFLGDVHRTPDRNLGRRLGDWPGLPASRWPPLDGDNVPSVASGCSCELATDPT